MNYRKFCQLVCFLTLLLAVTSCVAIRPKESVAIRSITPSEAVAINDDPNAATEATLMGYRDRISILALSGGGADGAYGVGVLNGWTQTGTRPNFDIVTGVSTGALMAVFAFLGPEYDEMLKRLYINQTDSDIFRPRGVAGLLSDSIYDNGPLKLQIEKFVTQDILDKIASEHNSGRRLYVATTNLDAGELVVWDMGLLARGGADGRTNNLQLFQKVLRASAAIPVLFPPVYIKPKRGVQLRQAHVDGGVKAPVLLSDFLFSQPSKTRDVYVIINGSLSLEDDHKAVEPNLQSIAAKSVSGLTRELTQQVLYRGYVKAVNSKSRFWLTAIPDDIPPLETALEFDADHLQRIYDRGERDVQRPDFWWTKPPTLKRFDVHASNG